MCVCMCVLYNKLTTKDDDNDDGFWSCYPMAANHASGSNNLLSFAYQNLAPLIPNCAAIGCHCTPCRHITIFLSIFNFSRDKTGGVRNCFKAAERDKSIFSFKEFVFLSPYTSNREDLTKYFTTLNEAIFVKNEN